jgi:hypothetical protein
MTMKRESRASTPRRSPPWDRDGDANALCVICPENRTAAGLVAAHASAMVLQTLGGAGDPSDPLTRCTFEYAIYECRVRRVLLCGHDRCWARNARAQSRAVQDDRVLGPLLRGAEVVLYPAWFCEDGRIFLWDPKRDRETLISHDEFVRLLE